MAHTLTRLLYHIVFSVKDRVLLISEDISSDLHAYLGGIIKEIKGTPLAISGTSDHVHLLVSLPSSLALSDALRILKTNSSRWIHQKWPTKKRLVWQTGFAAFTVSPSIQQSVEAYIHNQKEHHQKQSFKDEFLALLSKHGVTYDPKYIW